MKRIGILGHVGNKNLGDEAIIAAVIQGVRRRCGDAQVCGFTINPDDTTARHGIAAFPIRRRPRTGSSRVTPASAAPAPATGRLRDTLKRVPVLYSILTLLRDLAVALRGGLAEGWFLVRSYRVLRGLDLLIVAGSQQLSDNIDGPWAFPYTLFKWSWLARLAGARVVYLSLGAGPIDSPLSRWFIRSALAAASYRSYRDVGSQRLIIEIGGPAHDPVIPDLVHGLAAGVRATGAPRSAARIVGINPMPFADPRFWHDAGMPRYQHYVRTLAAFTLWLIERGHDVLLFPTQLRADPPVISDIRSILKSTGPAGTERRIVECSIESFDDLMAAIAACDMIVPTRFHGIVLAFLLHKPVLGIAYHPKARDLMAQMDQADYVVDVEPLDLATLQDRFVALEADRKRSAQQIETHAAACRRAVEAQYDTVVALLDDGRTRSRLDARGASRVHGPSAPQARDNGIALTSARDEGRAS